MSYSTKYVSRRISEYVICRIGNPKRKEVDQKMPSQRFSNVRYLVASTTIDLVSSSLTTCEIEIDSVVLKFEYVRYSIPGHLMEYLKMLRDCMRVCEDLGIVVCIICEWITNVLFGRLGLVRLEVNRNFKHCNARFYNVSLELHNYLLSAICIGIGKIW